MSVDESFFADPGSNILIDAPDTLASAQARLRDGSGYYLDLGNLARGNLERADSDFYAMWMVAGRTYTIVTYPQELLYFDWLDAFTGYEVLGNDTVAGSDGDGYDGWLTNLYDDTGVKVLPEDWIYDGISILTYAPPETGFHYVEITHDSAFDRRNTAPGTYSVSYESDTSIANDDYRDINALDALLENGVAVQGQIEEAGDVDVFYTGVVEGETYFAMIWSPDIPNLLIDVKDALGHLIETPNITGDFYWELFTVNVPGPDVMQVWTINVTSNDFANTGAYYVYYARKETALELIGAEPVSTEESAPLVLSAPSEAWGNFTDDTITGSAGNDHIVTLAGNDILNGGQGDDTLKGGSGSDVYVVDSAGDVVVETDNTPETAGNALDLGSHVDTVRASITYALTQYVEILELAAGSDGIDGTGNELDNRLVGNDSNNQLQGGGGNDELDGGGGIDTAIYSGNRGSHTVARVGDSWSVAASTGSDGTDTLVQVERLQFADLNLALDVSATGHAGQSLLFIGVLAFPLMENATVVGTILDLFDQGYTMQSICELAVSTGLTTQLAGSSTNEDLVRLVFRNVVGAEADQATTDALAGFMNGTFARYTQGQFLAAVASLELNQQHVDLVGLVETGIAFL